MAIYNREDPRTALPQLEKQFNARFDGLLDFFYPVGCYFETSDVEFDPNKSWGGEWELETQGQVHVSSGSNYAVSGALNNATDGGASTVTLDATQIPSHTHPSPSLGSFLVNRSESSGYAFAFSAGSYYRMAATETGARGGGQAHENMQPYIVVNRWHRVN